MFIKMRRAWARIPRIARTGLILSILVAIVYVILKISKGGIIAQNKIGYELLGPILGPSEPSISMYSGHFYLEKQKIRFLSGAIHYFRVVPEYWRDRMLKMKAAGLNTIETYVPWNLHEQTRGVFNFRGILDIRSFIQLAHELGFYVILRPGPYICSEWEFGGLPSWLLHDPNMNVRSTYGPFLDAVDSYIYMLAHHVRDLQYKQGGPIVAVQIENEYGAFGNDEQYMLKLKAMIENNGFSELLFTSDNRNGIRNIIPGVLQTVNFQELESGRKSFEFLREAQPGWPLFVMEYWSGWFDHWGERHHGKPEEQLRPVIKYILEEGASINFYMFHGGTNFGFMNGANSDTTEGTITSYDYDAPISESGDVSGKYLMIQDLLIPYARKTDASVFPPSIPKHAYGQVTMKYMITFNDIIKMMGEPIKLKDVVPMEMLPINNDGGQGYGFIVYRKTIPRGGAIKFVGHLNDRAVILLNGVNIAVIKKDIEDPVIGLTVQKDLNVLDIIVENTGRFNFASHPTDSFNDERKGIIGTVHLDGAKLEDWDIYPLEFKESFMQKCIDHGMWRSVVNTASLDAPALLSGELRVTSAHGEDTFLHPTGWTKGVAFINAFNIGRYWPTKGPQQTLYVPGPLLKRGKNKIMLFELHKSSPSVLFVDKPILG